MKISVAICTWNRAGFLDKTLDALTRVSIPTGVEWEVLVVNNNCTDHTNEVIAKYESNLPLRGILETKQGLSNARNRAVLEANGELLLWTDDDVLVAPNWLAEYAAAAKRFPDAAYFGGTVDPLYESEPPEWIKQNERHLSGPFAICQYDQNVRPLSEGEVPFGANMGFRLDVLKRFPFDTLLGRCGANLISGEEVDVIGRMKCAKLPGVWVGAANVQHWIPKERMTYKYVRDWYYGAGVSAARFENMPGRRILGMPRWAIRRYCSGLLSWLRGYFLRDAAKRVSGLQDRSVNAGVLVECRRQYKLKSR
jgi:glucosyl-dolichyl phosphate glucuronosyltransferase